MSIVTGYTLVCCTQHLVNMFVDFAKRLKVELPMPITFSNFIDKSWRGRTLRQRPTGFIIDDVHMFLNSFCDAQEVKAITINLDEDDDYRLNGRHTPDPFYAERVTRRAEEFISKHPGLVQDYTKEFDIRLLKEV